VTACDVTWPLLDPNPEDERAGHRHQCDIPHMTGDIGHICLCGDQVFDIDGVLYRPCDTCSDLVAVDQAMCDTCTFIYTRRAR
jgi:hypothetical protein